jgi:hypothetical protein
MEITNKNYTETCKVFSSKIDIKYINKSMFGGQTKAVALLPNFRNFVLDIFLDKIGERQDIIRDNQK